MPFFPRRGGRFAFVRADTPRFVSSPQLCYWRSLDHSKIHPRYLYSWLCGREFWLQASGVKSQTDMVDYVSLSDQRRFLISLPSIDEQKGIVDLFGGPDANMGLNGR